ncbi:hypothetical protein P7C73_g2371, partial [Tremellales sp. Uapishka_1]
MSEYTAVDARSQLHGPMEPINPNLSTPASLDARILNRPSSLLANPSLPYFAAYLDPAGQVLADDDIMKRSLDTSSLPVNPLNGLLPHIDPSSSFNDIPPKKARYSPAQVPGTAIGTPVNPGKVAYSSPYNSTPGFYPNALPDLARYGMANAQSPINLGGPLSQGHMQTPVGATNMGSGVGASGSANLLNQTPFMGMLNGMGLNGMQLGMMAGFPLAMGMNPQMMSPSMDANSMTGNYGPAAAAAAAAARGNTTGRTVYVGNLPPDASVDELLNLVRFGPIEAVRLLPAKSCVFISFLDGSTAAAFHADACVKKLALHGQELKIGWGKPSLVPSHVGMAILQSQATRNVFLGDLHESVNEQMLRDDLGRFGPIDQVKIVRDKNIGFVHFLSIGTAMKVVQQLPTEEAWAGKRVNYGKDRCAYVPKAQQAAVQAAQAQAQAAISSQAAQMPGSPFPPFSPLSAAFTGFATPGSAFGSPIFPGVGYPGMNFAESTSQVGNRCVYLGGIHPDTTLEELCNNIRGGMLQQIKYMPDKHIAFVTFVDATNALSFFQQANLTGLLVNNRKIKIGWGKPSGPPTPNVLQQVQAGASRNVYIGAVTDFETFTEQKLRGDFGEYGDIEMINFLQEKGAAFVNFTSIAAAVKAVEGIKSKPEYTALRVAYGKDRCGNAPRIGPATHTAGGQKSPLRAGAQKAVADSDPVAAAIAAVEAREGALLPTASFPDDGEIVEYEDEEMVDAPAYE